MAIKFRAREEFADNRFQLVTMTAATTSRDLLVAGSPGLITVVCSVAIIFFFEAVFGSVLSESCRSCQREVGSYC